MPLTHLEPTDAAGRRASPPRPRPPRACPDLPSHLGVAIPPPTAPSPLAPSPPASRRGRPCCCAGQRPSRADAERDHPLVLRLPVGTRLADAERKLILLTLEAVGGNKQRAARVLGISRRGLYSKLQAYGEHVGAQEVPEGTEAADSPEVPSEPDVVDPVEGAVDMSAEEGAVAPSDELRLGSPP